MKLYRSPLLAIRVENPSLEEGKYLLRCPFCNHINHRSEEEVVTGYRTICSHCKEELLVSFRPTVSFHFGEI